MKAMIGLDILDKEIDIRQRENNFKRYLLYQIFFRLEKQSVAKMRK